MFDPNVIIHAYTQGYFPMAHPDEDNAIFWHLPEKRGIIPLDHRFKVSKNLWHDSIAAENFKQPKTQIFMV
jgi:Leu/Phe-tRNA-protein transferase